MKTASSCLQCAVACRLQNRGTYFENAGFFKKVELGHLYTCICENCGPTVVDHEGRCFGACEVGHGDLPVPTFDVPTIQSNDHCLA